jgi:hypothetical protein
MRLTTDHRSLATAFYFSIFVPETICPATGDAALRCIPVAGLSGMATNLSAWCFAV